MLSAAWAGQVQIPAGPVSLLTHEADLAGTEPGLAGGSAPSPRAGVTRIVEVATDADGEHYALHGTGTNIHIQGVLNMVSGLYSDAGLVFTVSYQRAFSNAGSDPYSTCHVFGQWCELWSTWQLTQGGVHRDVVHLFSGKALYLTNSQGVERRIRGTSGLSATVCNLDHAYVLSTPYREAGLVAHEIGHALNAQHLEVLLPAEEFQMTCPDVDCGGDPPCPDPDPEGGPVMCGHIQQPTTGLHSKSVATIGTFVNNFGSCLAEQAQATQEVPSQDNQ